MLTIPEILNDAQISLYLSVLDVQKGTLFPRPLNRTSPEVIYTEYKSVAWAYSQSINYTGIKSTSNYLYWLTGAYNLQANFIREMGGGGIPVTPINPSPHRPQPLYFTVSSTSIIPTGGNTVSLPQYIGWNVVISRGGISQTQVVDPNNQYFLWNPITGVLFVYGNANKDESFTITPA